MTENTPIYYCEITDDAENLCDLIFTGTAWAKDDTMWWVAAEQIAEEIMNFHGTDLSNPEDWPIKIGLSTEENTPPEMIFSVDMEYRPHFDAKEFIDNEKEQTMSKTTVIKEMIGKRILGIYTDGGILGEEKIGRRILFELGNKMFIEFSHIQDCCEDVYIEDISCSCPLYELHMGTITIAEKTTKYEGDDTMWTFYRFCTDKGDLTIRWIGEDNGYYSKEVDTLMYTISDKKDIEA